MKYVLATLLIVLSVVAVATAWNVAQDAYAQEPRVGWHLGVETNGMAVVSYWPTPTSHCPSDAIGLGISDNKIAVAWHLSGFGISLPDLPEPAENEPR